MRMEEVEWGKFYSKFFFTFYSLSQFHETLEQRLLVTELTRLLGPSQEREVPPLLGLEKADLLVLNVHELADTPVERALGIGLTAVTLTWDAQNRQASVAPNTHRCPRPGDFGIG